MYEGGPVFWVGYSLQQLQTLQSEMRNPMDYPLCVFKKRIAFVHADGAHGKSPTHGNYACLITQKPEPELETKFWMTMVEHGAVKS
jgi:hypothetical protein